MSRIFRIEHHALEVGPYQLKAPDVKTNDLFSLFSRHSRSEIHPCLQDDKPTSTRSLKRLYSEWFFGFSSLSQLRKWFSNEDLRILHENGCNMIVYEVDKDSYIKYKKQTVFKKEAAKVLFKQNVISLIPKTE